MPAAAVQAYPLPQEPPGVDNGADEPAVAHFVGGEGKPWHYMVLKFQKQEDKVPPAVRSVFAAWDAMYWLAKTGKVCAGTLSDRERADTLEILQAA